MAQVVLLGAALDLLAGCERRPRPWAGEDGGAEALSPRGIPEPVSPSPAAEEQRASGPSDAPPAAPPLDAAPPGPPSGGLWRSCAEGLTPSGEPTRDATRLSLSCGPLVGMRRLAGLAGDVPAGRASVLGDFEAKEGGCYRLFVAGGLDRGGLEFAVRTSHGATVASGRTAASWAMLHGDRPFCALEADRFTIEVGAAAGAGPVAAELWTSPPDEPAD